MSLNNISDDGDTASNIIAASFFILTAKILHVAY